MCRLIKDGWPEIEYDQGKQMALEREFCKYFWPVDVSFNCLSFQHASDLGQNFQFSIALMIASVFPTTSLFEVMRKVGVIIRFHRIWLRKGLNKKMENEFYYRKRGWGEGGASYASWKMPCIFSILLTLHRQMCFRV